MRNTDLAATPVESSRPELEDGMETTGDEEETRDKEVFGGIQRARVGKP